MTKGSAIIILDEDGDIFLQQKDKYAPSNPNRWALWGGGSEEDESSVETIIREVKEELNISIDPSALTHIKEYKMEKHDDEMQVSVFLMSLKKNQKPILGEGKGLGFFNQQEIQCLRISPFAQQILADFFENHENNK